MQIETRSHAVLHALGVKGFATEEALLTATGVSAPELELALRRVTEDGLVELKARRVPGYALTARGRAEHRRLLAAERSTLDHQGELVWVYRHVFVPLDQAVKQLCTDWQLRPDGSEELVVNDHTDPGYDAGVRRRFTLLHEQAAPLMAYLARSVAPRFGRYEHRLRGAHGRFTEGEAGALCHPLVDSYHDTWMEVHQDLLLSLEQPRESEGGADIP